MKTITLIPFSHRGVEQVQIQFTEDAQLNELVSKIKGVKWSTTQRCWYAPLNRKAINTVIEAIGDKANINAEEINNYTKDRISEAKKFKLSTFLIVYGVICVLALIASSFQYARDNDTLGNSFIKNRLADLYLVLRFPLHNIFWGTMSWPVYIMCLGINWLMYAFIVERIIAFIRRPKASPDL
jgi:hypothetical protein